MTKISTLGNNRGVQEHPVLGERVGTCWGTGLRLSVVVVVGALFGSCHVVWKELSSTGEVDEYEQGCHSLTQGANLQC